MGTTQALFESIPESDKFHLFKGHQPNYDRVFEVLDFKTKEVSRAAGVSVESVRYDDKIPIALLERMTEWATAIALVANHFNDFDKTILWFKVSNPLLGGISPKDMIKVGRFNKLMKFIQTSLNENRR